MMKIEQLNPGVAKPDQKKSINQEMGNKSLIPNLDQGVFQIIKDRVHDGMPVDFRGELNPEQTKLWEETSQKMLQYLAEKYKRENDLIEKNRDTLSPNQEPPQGKNLPLFDFFSRGAGRDNIFKLDALLKEKTGSGIDFSDPGLTAIGELAMGPENFKKYTENLYIENLAEEEKKFMNEHRN